MYMHETNTHSRVNLYKKVQTKVMLKVIKVIGFSVLNACELSTAINCEILRPSQMFTFPDQMNLQFVLIMASNLSSQASFRPLITWMYANVRCRMDWFYRKPYICLLFILQLVKKKFGQSNMFNFCEYICTKEFWILGKNESSMASMLHTNMLRRSEMEMFFLNNRIKMEGEQ